MRRVVVTGLGCLTPVGNTPSQAFENLLQGISGIEIVPEWQNSLGVHIAGTVKNFTPEDWIEPKKDIRRMDRLIQLSCAAGAQAWKQAGLPKCLNNAEACQAGVILGVGLIGLNQFLDAYDVFRERGPERLSPFAIPGTLSNLASGHLAIRYNLKGSSWSLASACASGAHAIGEALMQIRHGRCKIMLAGGVESALHPFTVSAFHAMHALCKTSNENPHAASRPFDAKRCGFVMGEGAGILVLEDLTHALERGAPILAEIIGYGSTCDAFHVTAPPEGGMGAAQSMQQALELAGVLGSEVDYINAHGTSTPLNDRIETEAIKAVFGKHADRLAISSTKSMTGHLLGAAGGVEAVFSIMTLLQGQIPPTINLENPDPACDLDYVPLKKRVKNVDLALSNSFGFGGANASLLFQKYAE